MNSRKQFTVHALRLALAGAMAMPALVYAGDDHGTDRDFGTFRDHQLAAHSMQLFGIKGAIESSSVRSVDAATAESNPLSLVTLARSLRARVVASSADLGANIDMMTLWPREHPTHLIVCNEQGSSEPGVQRVRLSDGLVETILTGTTSCDPAHTTPWGTVVIGEEAGNSGSILEIIDPLHTTGVDYDRATGMLSGADAANVAVRPAVGHLSFEGVAIYPNGVLYYGDENRPAQGVAGGAYFKFIPSIPWDGYAPIGSLDESPLVSGTVYGLRLGKRSGGTDYGQGSNTGQGSWIPVNNAYDADLRAAAALLDLTGYYRPEDADVDQRALAEGQVRFCANNTGNEEDDHNWGETICVTDGSLAEATGNTSTPELQLLATGTREFAMMDNIAYQPGRGNWIIHEDGDAPGFAVDPHNNDIWACLEDGADVDTLSDGCIRIATLNDLNAESTGGFFDAEGRRFYFSVQHNVTGHGTILELTGWR
jgi:secreted PhoX family phosphatase